MIQKAFKHPITLTLNFSSLPWECELNEALEQGARTARAVAKQRQKFGDLFWLDEATTEAYSIVTNLIITSYEAILARYPEHDERFRFYRMSVGYGIKAYFAYRPLSVLRYLKLKGIEPKHVSFEEGYVLQTDHSAMMNLMIEEAAKTAMEKRVLEFYLLGNSYECIASKVDLNERRVKKVLRRIKRRLAK